jgi:hypothetical protein
MRNCCPTQRQGNTQSSHQTRNKKPGNAVKTFPGGFGQPGTQNGWQFLSSFGHFGAESRNFTGAEIVAETLLLIGTPS